jgi:CO/xanthine dehydrogenase Mo-binding subunit
MAMNPARLRVVGTSVPRVDAIEKVTGRARYTGDIALPGMLHGKILRSPHAHARIRSIDGRAAAEIPGVAAVLTRDDLGDIDPYYGPIIRDRPLLAIDTARYAGEPVAAVAATDEVTAERAASLIVVTYDELPAAVSAAAALAPGAPRLHEREYDPGDEGGSVRTLSGRNICHHERLVEGDVERGFAGADLVVEDTFSFPMVYHYTLEPHTVVARWEQDVLTVWASAQHPFQVRRELARIFRIPLAKVQMIIPFVGGGFGSKSYAKIEPLVAALARKAGRPVRVAQSVHESMHTTRRHSMTCRLKTGVTRDGTLVAKECAIHLDSGAYADNGPNVAGRAAQRVIGPYRIPHVRIDSYAVYTNSVPAGSFRAIGAPQTIWACESQMDIIADRLRIDPLELRLKNLLERGARVKKGMKPLDADISMGLRKTAEALGWSAGRVTGRGLGLACGFMGAGAFPVSMAIARLHADGSATLLTGTTEIGQGARTVLAQIAAEELALPLSMVIVAQPDTASSPFDRSTGASRSTTLMGLAVQRAAREIRTQLLRIGAKLLKTPAKAIELRDGMLAAGDGKAVSYADAITAHFGIPGGELVGRGTVRPPRGKPINPVFWEIGIGGAEVEVDRETGQLTVRRYVTAADVGKAINPRECEGQDEGAAMMGLGHTLFEAIRYEGDQIVNPNLIDYRVPLFTDLPAEFLALLVENQDGPGPYGAKGIGEGGIVAVAPAVASALARLTGVRIRDLPLTPERVWRALRDNPAAD